MQLAVLEIELGSGNAYWLTYRCTAEVKDELVSDILMNALILKPLSV